MLKTLGIGGAIAAGGYIVGRLVEAGVKKVRKTIREKKAAEALPEGEKKTE